MKLNIELILTDENIALIADAVRNAINTTPEVMPWDARNAMKEALGQSVPADQILKPGATIQPPAAANIDSTGIPWDARIHASTRAKIANGEWRLRRGIDDATLNKVLGELKQVMDLPVPGSTFTAEELVPVTVRGEQWPTGSPVPPAPPVAPPAPAMLDNNEKFLVGGQVFTRGQLVGGGWDESAIVALEKLAPVAPTPPAPPAPQKTPVTAVVQFPQLLEKVTKAIAAGTLTIDSANAAASSVGLPSFVNVAARPDLIPALMQALFK